MKTNDIRALSEEEMKKQLDLAEKEMLDLKFKLATKQLVNHRQIPALRKKIAQFNTVLKEKELGIR
jgi:large subunit ribosomal protein L29